jgi:hypothetical protein
LRRKSDPEVPRTTMKKKKEENEALKIKKSFGEIEVQRYNNERPYEYSRSGHN